MLLASDYMMRAYALYLLYHHFKSPPIQSEIRWQESIGEGSGSWSLDKMQTCENVGWLNDGIAVQRSNVPVIALRYRDSNAWFTSETV